MRILTWNVAWASSQTPRGDKLLEIIKQEQVDIAVLTEVTCPFVNALGGYVAMSDPDYGYASPA
ncbi:MAG: endonuclease/exonuclease/phosphatase family protein, partial [Thermosynechococcaceae cyanobacterium]